jgi:hypothetical protein
MERDGTPVSSDTPFRAMRRACLLLAACLIACPALAQRGAMTIPRNLDQLTDRATDIVRGTVVETRVEKHPELTNLNTIVVTVSVSETLKGDAAGTFTFRQYIWDIRDSLDTAGYGKGQEVLLLMNAPTQYGLSSPTGMQQGRFQIERDRTGRKVAVNGMSNVRLFEGLGDAASRGVPLTAQQASLIARHRGGPIEVGELTALIRAFARNP